MLNWRGKVLNWRGQMLNSWGKVLNWWGKMLNSRGKALNSRGKALNSRGKVLNSRANGQRLAPLGGYIVGRNADSCGQLRDDDCPQPNLMQAKVTPSVGTKAQEMRTVRTVVYPLFLKCVP